MANEKDLVQFNIQNVKYAFKKADGTGYDTPVSYGTSMKITLEADSSVKKIYGDGRVQIPIVNDKGKTGTLTTNNINNDYEIACGRKMKLGEHRIVEIEEQIKIEHAIYFEVSVLKENGGKYISKTWLYGVTSSRPAENHDQNTEDINESSFDTALEIKGTLLEAANGEPYKMPNGNTVYVWQMTVTPEDPDYDTFGDTVAIPKKTA